MPLYKYIKDEDFYEIIPQVKELIINEFKDYYKPNPIINVFNKFYSIEIFFYFKLKDGTELSKEEFYNRVFLLSSKLFLLLEGFKLPLKKLEIFKVEYDKKGRYGISLRYINERYIKSRNMELYKNVGD